jgi:NAD(P)H dehydrogenase (quinone)
MTNPQHQAKEIEMIAVTGATGHLGRLVIQELLERDVEPGDIAALARTPGKAEDLAGQGIEVRRADYAEPETLGTALDGIDRLLLVSSSEVGRRVDHHRNVIGAAGDAGVSLLVYTSILKADTGGTQLAAEHRATEELIRDSGIPFVVLRNGWYLENYTENLGSALEHGVILGSADGGRVSGAARADFAAAAAVVLTGSGHEGRRYELGGDEAFTLAELAGEVSRQSGRTVEYRDIPEAEYAQALIGWGMPQVFARMLADADRGIARGELYTDSDALHRLIGRPTTPLAEAVREALAG